MEHDRDGPVAVTRCLLVDPSLEQLSTLAVPLSRRFNPEVIAIDLSLEILLEERNGIFDQVCTKRADLVVCDILHNLVSTNLFGENGSWVILFVPYQFHGLQDRKQGLKAIDDAYWILRLQR